LNGTPTNAAELLELLLLELGVNAHRATRVERLQMWRQFLNEMSATESRLFVVVERTEDLDAAMLHALDALTAADANGSLGANVVLLGHENLDRHLAVPLLDSLRQRIRLRQRLEPFASDELVEYLRHQVARAGGELTRIFEPNAIAAIHRYTNGNARTVNNFGGQGIQQRRRLAGGAFDEHSHAWPQERR
jgi:type II secretory pathway predicted ATPase ExeA